jgi:hypothetical protein
MRTRRPSGRATGPLDNHEPKDEWGSSARSAVTDPAGDKITIMRPLAYGGRDRDRHTASGRACLFSCFIVHYNLAMAEPLSASGNSSREPGGFTYNSSRALHPAFGIATARIGDLAEDLTRGRWRAHDAFAPRSARLSSCWR